MIKETPMMRQWSQIKRQQPDAIVLFRLGDFYEAFNEDAKQLAEVCEVTLTSRPVAKGERAPMAGVPYHAVDGYIAQLVRRGLKVAIVEQLGGGTAEILVMIAAPLFGLPLALLPAQILWINLVTHGLPGLALGVERAEPDTMDRPPRRPDENIFGRGLWQRIVGAGLLTAAVALGLALWEHGTHGPWQTMLFTSLALLQLGDALAVRSDTTSTFTLRFTTNRFLLFAVIGTLGAQMAAIYLAPFQQLLTTEALGIVDLLIVLAASTITFWAIEAEKLVRRRRATASSERASASQLTPSA
jgi:Ca2+-transporting ATPase